MKTFVNEFAAYDELGKLIDNKATFYNWTENYNRTWSYTGDLDITFYPDYETFNTTDVLYYGYIQVGVTAILCQYLLSESNEMGKNSKFEMICSAISAGITAEPGYSLLRFMLVKFVL